MVSHSLSRTEGMLFFKVGRGRFDRLRDLNPLLPIPRRMPASHRVTAEDKELVRLFMKAQPVEPGYPCHHRSTPLYLEDPNVTLTLLHQHYKLECQDRGVRVLEYTTFRKVVKFIMPTLHLGRTKTDTCNSCFSLELQIKDPETSAVLKEELIAAKRVHLEDAIRARKAISDLIKSVKQSVAPNDPELAEDPVYVPTCFKDPYDRLNRPFVKDHVMGTVGEEEPDAEYNKEVDLILDLSPANEDIESDNNVEEIDEETKSAETVSRKMKVSVQDFGSGIPLPHYGANQPNHDYYASNLTLHNMNFVDCSTGICEIYYYDERQAGKDGNSVNSLRWNNTKQFINRNPANPPTAECKVMDNCVGQNKSNTTHKFSMFTSILLYPDGVTDIYFRVGHSHNLSDMKTAHANKGLAKKNLYTPQAVAVEVNKIKGLAAQVLDDRDGIFLDWKSVLDKHFPNMDPGFTSYYIFEFKNGVVDYKELDEDGNAVTVKSKVFCADPVGLRRILLRELFNLSSTSDSVEICRARPRLAPLPMKRISEKKIENMRTLYQQIPAGYRWFYPEGNTVHNEPFSELRARAVEKGHVAPAGGGQVDLQDEVAGDEEMQVDRTGPLNVANPEQNIRKVGRPKTIPVVLSNQPAIHRFMVPRSRDITSRKEINNNPSTSSVVVIDDED